MNFCRFTSKIPRNPIGCGFEVYGKMKLADLQKIINEYRDNPVVLEIIKARVISYVYNNYVDYGTRQKIGQLCQLKLVDDTGINLKKLYDKTN